MPSTLVLRFTITQKKRMSKKPFFHIQMAASMPEIYLFGMIGYKDDDDGILFADFYREIKSLEGKYKEAKIVINSPGGNMYHGLGMFDVIESSSLIIHCDIIGVAASMAAIIPLACKGKVRAAKNSSYMLHKPKGGTMGSSSNLRTYADQMDTLEGKAKSAVMSRTKKSDQEVSAWFVEGQDTWFTAEQLLAYGLIDEIIDPFGNVSPPSSPKAIDEVWSQYQGITMQLINENPISMKKAILAMLASLSIVNHGLTEELSDDQFTAKLKELYGEQKTKIENMQATLDAGKAQAITSALDAAEQSGKIAKEDRPSYEALMKADFDAAQAVIAKLPARQDINLFLEGGSKSQKPATDPNDRSAWTIRDYETKAPEALLEIKQKEPAKYKAMFKSYYGQEPD